MYGDIEMGSIPRYTSIENLSHYGEENLKILPERHQQIHKPLEYNPWLSSFYPLLVH